MPKSEPDTPPLLKELSESLKEPLKLIEKLTNMGVFVKNTTLPKSYKHSLPKIIVLDETSQETSVLKELVGLNLPTNFVFPIVIQFKTDSTATSKKIQYEFRYKDVQTEKKVITDESCLKNDISQYLDLIPEGERSDAVEVILTVLEPNVCNLGIIYLPKLRKQDDEDEDKKQIHHFEGYVHQYTIDGHGLFLNVLSTSTNIEATLSRKLLSRLDHQGICTITVYTQLGLCTDYMISQITSKKMSIVTPFGYYFVKDDETEKDEEMAKNQSKLLSRVDQQFIGFVPISKNLVLSMLAMFFSPYSQIIQSIDSDLEESAIEIQKYQQKFKSVSDASEEISEVVNLAIVSLIKLFELQEYREYEHIHDMHVGAEMACRYRTFKYTMKNLKHDKGKRFLLAEIDLLQSRNWPMPATFVSSTIGQALLEERFKYASGVIDRFVLDIVHYVEKVVVKVLLDHSKAHEQLHPFFKQIARMSVQDLKENFKKELKRLVELEKKFIYTSNESFDIKLCESMDVKLVLPAEGKADGKKFLNIVPLGDNIRVEHLENYLPNVVQQAFELKKMMNIYWDFVVDRVVDNFALNLQACISDMLGVGIKRMKNVHLKKFVELPATTPAMSFNELMLKNRISDLKKAKEDVKKWQYEIEFLI
ncbi:putative dynamin GTPase [Helianthus anomalus]